MVTVDEVRVARAERLAAWAAYMRHGGEENAARYEAACERYDELKAAYFARQPVCVLCGYREHAALCPEYDETVQG